MIKATYSPLARFEEIHSRAVSVGVEKGGLLASDAS
jgi:hypothetical protein